jgi:putative hydrolase of HD superfamily
MKDHTALTPFFDLLCEYQRVERLVYVPHGGGRKENNVEHSYVLAMLAWYIIGKDSLNLDTTLVLKYALAHDLVEVYAGDTSLFDARGRETKHAREAAAADRLGKEFSEFGELHNTIEQYENLADRESRFIKALDKLVPMYMAVAEGGRVWREHDITLERIVELKQPFMDHAPEIQPYFDSFIAHLRTRPELFNRADRI